MTRDDQIFKMVKEAYEDAKENGYDPIANSALGEIANDMLDYGAFVGEEIEPTVEEVVVALCKMKQVNNQCEG